MSNQPEQVSNNQALATVVRFLKQHNLNVSLICMRKLREFDVYFVSINDV